MPHGRGRNKGFEYYMCKKFFHPNAPHNVSLTATIQCQFYLFELMIKSFTARGQMEGRDEAGGQGEARGGEVRRVQEGAGALEDQTPPVQRGTETQDGAKVRKLEKPLYQHLTILLVVLCTSHRLG